MKSEFGKLKTIDFWKALIVAGFSSSFTTLSATIAIIIDFADFNWRVLIIAFGVGFLGGLSGYLSKNLFTNSTGQPFKKECKNYV